MAYRIQVNNKKYSIRVKRLKGTLMVGAGAWRQGRQRCYTTFSIFTPEAEIKVWFKGYIRKGEGEFFTR